MTALVVDTNVAIVANGRDADVDAQCRSACVERLTAVVADEVVAIDDAGAILQEYAKHLSFAGMPGVGDMFFKHVFNCQHQSAHVRRVAVTPSEDDRRGFEELPDNTFDRSDRKFLAVAVAAGTVVLNATDSDWREHEELMDELGVEVTQICVQYSGKNAWREG